VVQRLKFRKGLKNPKIRFDSAHRNILLFGGIRDKVCNHISLEREHLEMTTRNLTRKFVEVRNAAKANRTLRTPSSDESSDTELLQGAGNSSSDSASWKASKDTLPPLWVDNIEQAEADISKIQAKSTCSVPASSHSQPR
jgi:hypothetical protein